MSAKNPFCIMTMVLFSAIIISPFLKGNDNLCIFAIVFENFTINHSIFRL